MSHWDFLITKLPKDVVNYCIRPYLLPSVKNVRVIKTTAMLNIPGADPHRYYDFNAKWKAYLNKYKPGINKETFPPGPVDEVVIGIHRKKVLAYYMHEGHSYIRHTVFYL